MACLKVLNKKRVTELPTILKEGLNYISKNKKEKHKHAHYEFVSTPFSRQV
jgi:hypothetical protein